MNLHTLKSLAKLSGEEYLTSNYSHLGMRLIEISLGTELQLLGNETHKCVWLT